MLWQLEQKTKSRDGNFFLRNHKRDDIKCGKLVKPWIGPYTVTTISSKNNCSLKNVNKEVLIKKYNITSLFL